MQLPVAQQAPPDPGQRRRRRLWLVLAPLAVVVVLETTAAGPLLARALAEAIERRGGGAQQSWWRDAWSLLSEALPRQLVTPAPALDKLVLDVGFAEWNQLRARRDQALRLGLLLREDGEEVPATIRHGADQLAVRLRLKGDLVDHLDSGKWSLRVKVRNGGHLLGMSEFSLQHPRTKGYQAEALFLEHARREGILAPRYFLVQVVVNGVDLGQMVLEEQFAVELLESQGRREGPILRFAEDLRWRTAAALHADVNFSACYPDIACFEPQRIAADPKLQQDRALATALLRGVLAGTLPPGAAFDVSLTARYLALCELYGAHHALAWNNLRFYMNPVTARLEPIAFDGNVHEYGFQKVATALLSVERAVDPFVATLVADAALRARFLAEVHRLAAALTSAGLLPWLQAREQELLAALHDEFPYVAPVRWDLLAMRAARLQQVDEGNHRTLLLLDTDGPPLPHLLQHVHAFRVGDRLELFNLTAQPVEVIRIDELDPAQPATSRPAATRAVLPLRLEPAPPQSFQTAVVVELHPAVPAGALQVTTRIAGNTTELRTPVRVTVAAAAAHPLAPLLVDEALRRFPFLARTETGVRVGPGIHRVPETIALPAGCALEVAAGATLRFAPDAALLLRAPLHLAGTASQPVVLEPEAGAWQGIAVLDAGAPSRWTHATVRATSGIERRGWRLEAGVLFHGSPVELVDCRLTGNRSEDAVNLFRCDFRFERVTIADTSSDAFDADFCRGELRDCQFADTGGDALDTSGSQIRVHGARMQRIRDKALSVGEASTLDAEAVEATDVGTGIACKDGSRATLRRGMVRGARVAGVMCYVKKPAYGPAHAVVEQLVVEDVARPWLAQTGSSLTVEGKAVTPEPLDVDALYAGAMKK
jgi:hypothetical protein